jgi:AraC family transcriptional regulator
MSSQVLLSGSMVRVRNVHGDQATCDAMHVHDEAYFEFVLMGTFVQRWHRHHAQRAPGQGYLMAAGTEHADCFVGDTRSLSLEFLRERENTLVTRCGVTVLNLPAPPLHRLVAELAAGDDLSSLWVDVWAADHLLQALRGGRAADAAPHQAHAPPKWLRLVHEALHDDAGPVRTLSDLADAANVHPAHLSRAFRLAYGVPVVQFQRQRRLALAAQALARGDPVARVALAAGYDGQGPFTTAFRRAFGVPPARWQAQRSMKAHQER